jgi:2-keto-3-deoxy-L-rhamnonate aldolase RhmA
VGGTNDHSEKNLPRLAADEKMKKSRSLHRRLSNQPALLGLLQTHPNPLLVKMAVQFGYDFLFLDAEHGVLAESDYAQIFAALAESDLLPIVRLADQDPEALVRYVAMGAAAIVVPHVSTVEEARRMVEALDRAMAVAPLSSVDRAAVTLIVIIESATGVENAQDILATDGVDAVIVGPSDLSADLGSRGNYASRAYADALVRIERAAVTTGKPLGTIPHGEYTLDTLLARGHRILLTATDIALISEALSAHLALAHSSVQSMA